MNYKQTIAFLYDSLPAFHRVGGPAYKANLENTLALDAYFGHPHRNFRSLHIAGTNGKGSVSHMLAAVLQQCGYRTGLYTSPHLNDFTERIRIDGQAIAQQEVVQWVEQHRDVLDQLRPSFFEMSVAMAFDYFAREEVDVAIVEVGMEGRLDSTNIITPVLSVITNISYDHTQFLGKTLPLIAGEKAGIIKPGVPVVIGETQAETKEVFRQTAENVHAPILFADQRFMVTSTGNNGNRQLFELKDTRGETFFAELDLLGSYQAKNITTVHAALECLQGVFGGIDRRKAGNALRDAAALTGLRGRWELIGSNPTVICDTAHNEAGVRLAMEQLKTIPHRKLHIVFGMVRDKDQSAILSLLPVNARYYFTRADIPRAVDEKILLKMASGYGLEGNAFPSVAGALQAARLQAAPEDLIFVGGSTFVVSEIL